MSEKEPHRNPVEPKKNFEGNPRTFLNITGRSFEQVEKELTFDQNSIPSGAKVLVVGEGFSDFSAELQRRRSDASVVAVDRLYAIAQPTDSMEEVQRKLVAAGYDSRMTEHFEHDQRPDRPTTAGEKAPLYVAGDVYALPLADNSVEVVYLNHVYEHIDLGKALPELLRVLKEGGEIRFGGLNDTCSQKIGEPVVKGEKGTVYLGRLKFDMYDGNYLDGEDWVTTKEGFRILAEKPEIKVYGYMVDSRPNRYDKKTMVTLVFSKGTKVPAFSPPPDEPAGVVIRIFPERMSTHQDNLPFLETEVV